MRGPGAAGRDEFLEPKSLEQRHQRERLGRPESNIAMIVIIADSMRGKQSFALSWDEEHNLCLVLPRME